MAITRKHAQQLMDALREVSWQGASARRRTLESIPGTTGGYSGIFLATIARSGAIRLSELASALQVDTSVASRHVASLMEAGYIERTVDPSDGRAQLLRLSREGEQATRTMRDAQTEWLRRALRDWDDTRAQLVADSLAELAQHISKVHEQGGQKQEEKA